ncbi:MAG: response regulator [Desulfofustis sp.]|jgi:putative nucleotidyltransferase with HDIG domain|nr:response regulator [Desulfofustis sp.]
MQVKQEKTPKILVADDDALVCSTVRKILETFGYQVVTTTGGNELLDTLDSSFDVILIDINMPGMNGFETIEKLNGRGLGIPVLLLTGSDSMDDAVKAINLGVHDFLSKPIDDLDIFNVRIKRAVEKRNFVLQERRYKKGLEEDIRKKALQLEEQNKLLRAYSDSLENATVQLMSSLQRAMEEKDHYTAGHTMRVTNYAVILGAVRGLDNHDLVVLRRAAQFHDIGKLVIDLSCIQKNGPLSPEERELINEHPGVGANIIKPLGFMEREQFIIRHHHERIDGTGYPDGLAGDQLDELTKIITVADSYDAMTSSRNYRRNMNIDEAVSELVRCSGSQFDGEIVQSFTENIHRFRADQFLMSQPYQADFNHKLIN